MNQLDGELDGEAGVRARVLALATRVEHCRMRALDWYRHEAIREFGEATAAQMVRRGEGARVLAFLSAIAGGERD